MPEPRLTPEQKSLYKRNVDFLVANIPIDYGGEETENVELDIDAKLKVRHLQIKGISPELQEEIKKAIEGSLLALMSNFEEFRDGGGNEKQLMTKLEITLADYVEYVLKNS